MRYPLTQERLRELFNYDPSAGVFTRRVSRGCAKIGSIAGWKSSHGHVAITIDRRDYFAHRLAWFWMKGRWPEHEVDHINGLPGDNRFANLRTATHAQNMKNMRMHKDNKSGVKGVRWHKAASKWCAEIWSDGERIHLGLFLELDAARKAYATASTELHGDFGRTT